MISALLWTITVTLIVWSVAMLHAAWRDRRRPVRGSDDRWHMPRATGGWGPRR